VTESTERQAGPVRRGRIVAIGILLFALATALVLSTNYALYLDVKHDRETGAAGPTGQSVAPDTSPLGYPASIISAAASQTLLVLFLIGAGSFVFLRAHRHISQQLSTTTRHLDNVQRLTDSGYWEFDVASQKLWWSGGMYRMLGLEPGEVKDCLTAYLDAAHPDDRAQLRAATSRIIDDRQPCSIRHRSILADGTEITIRLQVEVAIGDNGDVYQIRGTGRNVTEEYRAEGALIESNFQLETLTKTSAVGLFKSDKAGFITYANDSLCEMFGLDRAEALVAGWHAKLHPADTQRVETEWRAAARVGKPHETEYRVIANGVERWMYAQARPEFDEGGSITGYVGTVTDITEREHDRQSLIESESQLKALAEFSPVGLFKADLAGNVTYANESLGEIFSLSYGEIMALGWTSTLHPDDAPRVAAEWKASTDKSAPYKTEYRIVAGGAERWVYAQGRPERNHRGDITNYVGTITDITERKSTEDTIKRSEERLRMILDTAADGIITMSPQREIMSFNAAAEDIFGYEASEVVGQNIKILMPEPYRTNHDGYVVSYLSGGEEKVINSGRDVQGQRKDGSVFPLYLAVSAPSNESSAVFTGIVRDITDAVEAERQLLEARDQAETANLAKSEFLSRMSHELRTPMNAILGFAQLLELQSAEPLTADQQRFVEQILGSGRHLLTLINEILDLSKIEAGGLVIEIEDINAVDAVRESLDLVGSSARARDIKLSNQLEGADLPAVRANATSLKQVITNLLSNAIKYNVEGGRVTISTELLDRERLRISVQDTGPGIPLERQSELFQPFARLDAEHSEIEGTGIGLSITKNLVELMGGEIRVDSHPGSGSTFSIDLQLAPSITKVPTKSV
jgi:PAS domain S-box-containing protein